MIVNLGNAHTHARPFSLFYVLFFVCEKNLALPHSAGGWGTASTPAAGGAAGWNMRRGARSRPDAE